MTLSQLKSRLSISQVLQHYGLQPDKNGMFCCPFHRDKNPSMKVYYETNTVYCFSGKCPTHGHSLDVVDFVMWKEGWEQLGKEGKNRAIKRAKSLAGEQIAESGKSKQIIATKMNTTTRIELLTHAWAYFQQNLNADAEQYLKERHLDYKDPSLRPLMGYNPGKLQSKSSKRNKPDGLQNRSGKAGSYHAYEIAGLPLLGSKLYHLSFT